MFFFMDKDATASKNESMPKKIGQLVGATNTHEIVFEAEMEKRIKIAQTQILGKK